MRTCKKCFTSAYVFVGGDVRFCCWNEIIIGNLKNNTLEEIWNSEAANSVRKEFMAGNLVGCHQEFCYDCMQNSPNVNISSDQMEKFNASMSKVPIDVSLSYDERCNHACPSCRKSFFKASDEYMSDLKTISENIEPYLNEMEHISANGIGDLFVSTEIVDMLSKINSKKKLSLFLETNGVLFKDNWHKISNLRKYDITVSVTPSSFDRETYKYLAGKDDLVKFEESMAFISELKKKGDINRIRLIMVIQDSNFRQIPNFISRGIEYDADDIVLRPIYKWFDLSEDERLFKNVLNPCHPYHNEYLEIIKNPICRNPRVINHGFDNFEEPVEFPTLAMKQQYNSDQKLYNEVDNSLDLLAESINAKKNAGIILFGVGVVGKYVLSKIGCSEEGYDIKGFLVSNRDNNVRYWMGYKVESIEDNDFDKDCLVIVCLSKNNQVGVEDELRKANFKNIISI